MTAAVTPARVAVAEANGIDLATTDQVLTEAARALGPEDTAKAVRRWVAGIDPDGALDDAAGLPRMFRMAVSADGRVYLSGHLDPVGGETVHAALEAVMNGDRPAGDRRTHGRADGRRAGGARPPGAAAGDAARRARRAPPGAGDHRLVRPVRRRGAPGFAGGELPFAGPITRRDRPPAGLRRRRGPDPHRPGRAAAGRRPGAAHRHRRDPPRRSSSATGTACSPAAPPRPPGATSTTSSTGRYGGPTSCENGALLCERHHTAVHEGGFSIARDPGTAVWHTYRPDGTEIRIRGTRARSDRRPGAGPASRPARLSSRSRTRSKNRESSASGASTYAPNAAIGR